MHASQRFVLISALLIAAACGEPGASSDATPTPASPGAGGKADDAAAARRYEVVLTEPHCDVCTPEDKAWLRARSPVIERVVALIDGARAQIDAAQFTFSVREIEDALRRAHERGVRVRLAIDAGQDREGSVARRLAAAGLPVRFVSGRSNGEYAGLQHAKFMLVDGVTLLTGSNNWSSTGTTINEENVTVVHGAPGDALIGAFACHFEAIWAADHAGAGDCSVDGLVGFTPGSAPIGLLVGGIRSAERSIDVLMHHLLFDKLLKELAKAAERGVRVRIVVNAADREETTGRHWDRLRAAGAAIRYKRTNPDLYQLLHHKLAIIDGRVLLNGSGNWSGSAFFNNFENYVRYDAPEVVRPYRRLFARLWTWSLTAESLDAGVEPARQHAATTRIFFGNLHAHFHAEDGGATWDDGRPARTDEAGEPYPVDVGSEPGEAARRAFEYARDRGAMDFMALTPHVVDDREDDAPDLPSMRPEGFEALREAAAAVTKASEGAFVALAGMEWSTNSTGNHVTVLGSRALAKVERGRFDLLYDEFLPARTRAGDRPLLVFNHPRTFRHHEGYLTGNWDQIFGVPLTDIPKAGQRDDKFNDYGLDDYPPLAEVREAWIAGEALPDPAVVHETLRNVEAASRPYARLMEVTVGRGKELGGEEPVNPSLSETEDGRLERFTKVHSDWDYYLLRGFRLAPAANHDNHYANWGAGHTTRTAVQAPALTEEALLDAIDARAVYASEDENLALRFYAAGRVPMGGVLRTLSDRVAGEIHLSDPDGPARYTVRVLRGTVGGDRVEAVQEFADVAPDRWHTVALDLPAPGEHFFYLEVHDLEADRMAWSAPIWIERP